MSKQDPNEENENTITYVYIPDEEVYGVIKKHGAWSSLIEYHEAGVGFMIEIPNDEFIIVEEINIAYIDETEENL